MGKESGRYQVGGGKCLIVLYAGGVEEWVKGDELVSR